MAALFRHLSVCFAAGLVGGLANAIFVWGAGAFGLSALMGVAVAPEWSPGFLYQKIVWGGVWGLLFVLPLLEKSVFARGVLYGLGPTAVQLLVVFPGLGKGMYGLDLGQWTPVFVLMANTVWGLVAASWMVASSEPSRGRGRL